MAINGITLAAILGAMCLAVLLIIGGLVWLGYLRCWTLRKDKRVYLSDLEFDEINPKSSTRSGNRTETGGEDGSGRGAGGEELTRDGRREGREEGRGGGRTGEDRGMEVAPRLPERTYKDAAPRLPERTHKYTYA